MLHVCFVCSGNTCRSPIAALVFRTHVEQAGLLRSFDPAAEEGAEIADPYSGEPEGYEDLLAMIELTMPELLRWSRQQTNLAIT